MIIMFIVLIRVSTYYMMNYHYFVIGAAGYLAKFIMMEWRSLWHFDYLLIKQRDKYNVTKLFSLIHFAGYLAALLFVFLLGHFKLARSDHSKCRLLVYIFLSFILLLLSFSFLNFVKTWRTWFLWSHYFLFWLWLLRVSHHVFFFIISRKCCWYFLIVEQIRDQVYKSLWLDCARNQRLYRVIQNLYYE